MRRRRPSKQRLRLGSDRYLCCGRRRYTDADTHRYCDGDPICNGDAYCYPGTEVYSFAKGASYASTQAVVFSRLEFLG